MNPLWVQLLNAGKIMRLTAVFFSLLVFAAQPAAAESSPSLWNLERQLAFWWRQLCDVGIAAIELNRHQSVDIGG